MRVRVEPVPGMGMGLVADEDIAAGTPIMQYTGVVKTTREEYSTDYTFGITHLCKAFVIDAMDAGNEARFANHSCQPSCYALVLESEDGPQLWLIAGDKGVKNGDWITIDYQWTCEYGRDPKPCLCGEDRCRGFLHRVVPEARRSRSNDQEPEVLTDPTPSEHDLPNRIRVRLP